MSRRNQFRETNLDFASMIGKESTEDNLTKTIVKELDNQLGSSNEILIASPDMFIPYEDEKLRLDLHQGEDRERLKESIRLNGIFTPVICVKKDDKYMILSGHNRVDVARELGIDVPYILKNNLSDEEKELICIDDNLIHRQRTDYKPMQLAYLIKVKMEAEKHQGKSLGTQFPKNTGDKIGEEHALTRRMIGKYLKLNELSDNAKKMVDNRILTISAGYELAFLEPDLQDIILSYWNEYKINEKNIKEIRKKLQNMKLESDKEKRDFIMNQILLLCGTKGQKRNFDFRNVKKFIPEDIDDSNAESYVIEAVKYYNQIRKQQI